MKEELLIINKDIKDKEYIDKIFYEQISKIFEITNPVVYLDTLLFEHLNSLFNDGLHRKFILITRDDLIKLYKVEINE